MKRTKLYYENRINRLASRDAGTNRKKNVSNKNLIKKARRKMNAAT